MAQKSKDWVKIHCTILQADLKPSQFKLFVGSIILANPPGTTGVGMVDLSVRQLSHAIKMSSTEVWRREQELAELGMITLQSKGFLINKYSDYQDKYVPPTKQTPNGICPAGGTVSGKMVVLPAKQKIPQTEQVIKGTCSAGGTAPIKSGESLAEKKTEKTTIDELIDESSAQLANIAKQMTDDDFKKMATLTEYKKLPAKYKDYIHAMMNCYLLKGHKEGKTTGQVVDTLQETLLKDLGLKLTPLMITLQTELENKKMAKG